MKKTSIIAILAIFTIIPIASASSGSASTTSTAPVCSVSTASGSAQQIETLRMQLESAEKLISAYSERGEKANEELTPLLISAFAMLMWVLFSVKQLYTLTKFRPKSARMGRYVFIATGVIIASVFAYEFNALLSFLHII